MIRKIPSLLSSDLVKMIMDMGHGDEIAIVDRNFPAHSICKNVINMPSVSVADMLKALIEVFPLDQSTDYNVIMMAVREGKVENSRDKNRYQKIIDKSIDTKKEISELSRFDFYDRAKQSYVIVSTGDNLGFANIIIKKGVLAFDEIY